MNDQNKLAKMKVEPALQASPACPRPPPRTGRRSTGLPGRWPGRFRKRWNKPPLRTHSACPGEKPPGTTRWESRERRPSQPSFLEYLEGRWVPTTVTNLLDSGPGSLRQAIIDTPASGTVDFQPGLTGTITLTSGELDLHQSITIQGHGAAALAVSGNNASRVFEVF